MGRIVDRCSSLIVSPAGFAVHPAPSVDVTGVVLPQPGSSFHLLRMVRVFSV